MNFCFYEDDLLLSSCLPETKQEFYCEKTLRTKSLISVLIGGGPPGADGLLLHSGTFFMFYSHTPLFIEYMCPKYTLSIYMCIYICVFIYIKCVYMCVYIYI